MNPNAPALDDAVVPAPARPRIVVVGGGFGGLTTARALADVPVDVVLVDRTNHHVFQPLLYQVATGILSAGEIAPSLRGVLRDDASVQVRLAEVTGFDLQRRLVYATAPDGDGLVLPYDFLVVAAGAAPAYFGHEEWERLAGGMKTLADAQRVRTRILGAFEMAADADDGSERDAWLTFVTVGAGPTGVELTGQIAELARRLLRREFTAIDTARARIVLLDAGESVLSAFPRRLRAVAARDLRAMGVEIRTGVRVTGIDAEGVDAVADDGERVRIDARTVTWAAGVHASPLARALAAAAGAGVDRAGRVPVGPDCALPGHPEVFAVGDMVTLDDLPGVAQPAIQEGRHVAGVIRSRVAGDGAAAPPFRFRDKGAMATVGRRQAVVVAFGVKVWGLAGALLWALVHLYYLVGWGDRFGTVVRWAWTLLARDRRELCIVTTEPLRRAGGAGADGDGRLPVPASPGPVHVHDAGGAATVEVHNRLDRVVLSVAQQHGRVEDEPIHPADARVLAAALRVAAEAAEQTPPS